MFNVIPFFIIITSFVVLFVLVLRHLPDISSLRLETLPEERERKQKEHILNQRLARKINSFKEWARKRSRPLLCFFREQFFGLYKKILHYENIHKEKNVNATHSEINDIPDDISSLLFRAEEFLEKDQYDEAEKIFIEVIKNDSKNISAYSGLALLYQKKGDYDLAFETIQYLVKIQPSHPKFLDALAELSIIRGDKKSAQEALLRLKEVNPDNAKIEVFQTRIEQMPT